MYLRMPSSEKLPTCADVEKLAQEMLEVKREISTIEDETTKKTKPLREKLAEMNARAEKWLTEFGSAHAEKSRILHGIKLELMGTFGTSTSIDAAAVELFRQGLVVGGQSALVKKLFEKTERWTLRPNWAETIRGTKLSAKLGGLFARCQVTKPRSPIITPREKSPAWRGAAAGS